MQAGQRGLLCRRENARRETSEPFEFLVNGVFNYVFCMSPKLACSTIKYLCKDFKFDDGIIPSGGCRGRGRFEVWTI